MDLLQKFPGTLFLDTYNEVNANDCDLWSAPYRGGEVALNMVFEYCLGMCSYEETIMKLEKELLFGLSHENSTQTYHRETLKQIDCDCCCAFINNVQLFRETVLQDYLFDLEEYDMPTPENCDLLNKIEDLHPFILLNLRANYTDHQILADKFFSNLNSTASFFCEFMENIKHTQDQFTITQLKQISLCLCQELARNHVLLAGVESKIHHH